MDSACIVITANDGRETKGIARIYSGGAISRTTGAERCAH